MRLRVKGSQRCCAALLAFWTCIGCGSEGDDVESPPGEAAQKGRVSIRIVGRDGTPVVLTGTGIVQFSGEEDFSVPLVEDTFEVELGVGAWAIVALMGTCNTFPAAEIQVTSDEVVDVVLTLFCNA